MAAIPTILKGDDSGAITINIASGRTYTGATLVVAYQGVTRQYTNLTPGGSVTLAFTHGETSGFALKTAPLLMRLIGQYGAEETVENAEARIRVTDCLAEVNAGGSFTVQPGGTVVDPTKVPITEVGDVAARYTLADLQAKVNQIVRVLAQRSLMAFGLCAMFASSAAAEVSVQTARLDELWNDSRVVTNVTGGGGSGVDTNSVKSIINAEVGGTNTLVHSDAIADMATKAWTRGEGYAKTNAQGKVTALETDPTATAKAQAAIAAAGCVVTNSEGVYQMPSGYLDIGEGIFKTEINYYGIKNENQGWSFMTHIFDFGDAGELSVGEYGFIKYANNEIVYGISTNGTDYLHADVNLKPFRDQILAAARTDSASIAEAKAADTRAIVATWENFLDGSNVVFSITNYISGTYNLDNAKFRILEMTNGFYREVYNSREEITMHINNFKNNDFRVATNQVITSVNEKISVKADKAWGRYTSAGGVAPSNTVYMTEPQTVFAGGLEYERVAVGEGSVCILTTAGAPVYTAGDEGTFKFQDDGGTNYFGFAKTDSYTIGCNTDGITVQNSIVTLTYNVTMSGVPCIWYKQDVGTAGPWEQLNLSDGTAVPGASHLVTWDMSPAAGTEVCYINCANQAKGFFKATVEVPGSAKFMTNMPADLGGGIICTNTATGVNGVIRPSFNGSTVIWSWSAQ